MLTAHPYQEICDMRNNKFDYNGRQHSMLGIVQVGECCRLSYYISMFNTMLTGYQGNNFQFRKNYQHIVGMQVNDEG
jgi:hypothetical protein